MGVCIRIANSAGISLWSMQKTWKIVHRRDIAVLTVSIGYVKSVFRILKRNLIGT